MNNAVAHITDTQTGETRQQPAEFTGLHHAYLWSEGNYSCDCNRGMFFAHAAGEQDPNRSCGDERYKVKIVGNDGTLLYEDEE